MKRRDFIKASAAGAIAAGVPFSFGGVGGVAYGRSPLLEALLPQASTDRVLVLINLEGGNDGLNTIIPYENSLYIQNRPKTGFISSTQRELLKNSYQLKPGFALNPVMDSPQSQSKLMKLWRDGKLAVVNNVGYAQPNRSHFRSTDIWNTASDSNVVLTTGWVGRYLESQFPNYPQGVQSGDDPIAIQIGAALNPVFQGSKAGMGLAVQDPSKYNAATSFADDPTPDSAGGHELAYVRSILLQSDMYGDRFQTLFPTTPKNKVTYPQNNRLAEQLKRVAWCIAAGMKTKVYFVSQGGYDTHVSQNSSDPTAGHGLLLTQLADAISAFQADLEASGVADRVIGMTYSEFGRRVNDNDSNGTDHGTCAPQLLFGTEINGAIYGEDPDLSDLDTNGDLKWRVDYRQLYSAVLADWFGTGEPLRKAILNDQTVGDRFRWDVALNGTQTVQSVIRTPASSVKSARASSIKLEQNFPNPFTPATEIRFSLAQSALVTLEVFDGRGSKVRTLVSKKLGRGEHTATFEAANLPAGTYYYRLESGDDVITKPMVLVK